MRGLLISDHDGADGALPENVLRVAGGLPFDWLFPRVSVAVHHGGAGTTAESLNAGTPSVVVPVVPDQEFWGWRVHALRLCRFPRPHKTPTPEKIVPSRLKTASDPRA